MESQGPAITVEVRWQGQEGKIRGRSGAFNFLRLGEEQGRRGSVSCAILLWGILANRNCGRKHVAYCRRDA